MEPVGGWGNRFVRIAVSGSHSTGKSTLVARFLEQRPGYLSEPEAFEVLGDDITLTSQGPDAEGLADLLGYSISVVESHAPGAAVILERSPVDYLAYAAASEALTADEGEGFVLQHLPAVRDSVRGLDLIVMLPVGGAEYVPARPGEDEGFRLRVDECLRRLLVDDDLGLFAGPAAAAVVEAGPSPDRQLAELLRRT
ncbi:MAG: AAA family ATPase [Acidobacteriota bacterium]